MLWRLSNIPQKEVVESLAFRELIFMGESAIILRMQTTKFV